MAGKLAIILITIVLVLACDDPEGPGTFCSCTEIFKTIRFALVDGQGQPETGATVFVVQLRTQQVLDSPYCEEYRGRYCVIDDGSKDRLFASGDTLMVLGAKDSRRFTATFVVGVDEPCRCHIQKIAGPDTVVLQ